MRVKIVKKDRPGSNYVTISIVRSKKIHLRLTVDFMVCGLRQLRYVMASLLGFAEVDAYKWTGVREKATCRHCLKRSVEEHR